MTRTALALCLVLAACGSGGDLPRCGADGDCAAGTVCERPVSGERGVCVAPYEVTLLAPPPGSWIGLAGAPVQASLRVRASGRTEPASIDLLADGSPVATLARTGPGSYEVRWIPAGGTPRDTSLAAAVARATADEVRSAPVGVRVDVEAPALSGASAACAAAPCARDASLRVTATAADANLLSLEATLDLDPGQPVPMALVGTEWVADVDLGALPFPALARDVGVIIRARDAAGNEASQVLPTAVTRVRWTYDASAPGTTSPAIFPDGTLVIGVTATTRQVRAIGLDGAELWATTVGAGAITAPPSIGPTAIWIASQDGKVYAVKPDGSAILNGSGCNTGGALQGTPAIGSTNPETAFVGSGAGRPYAADAAGLCAAGPLTDSFSAPPSLDSGGKVLAATATATATATLRKYAFDGAAFVPDWSVQVGVNVAAPIAVGPGDESWTGSQDAKLNATATGGATRTVKTLGGSIVDSPVILAGGDVVVGDQARVLHRFQPDGTQVWASEPVLDGPVLAPLALAGGAAALLVPTAAGTLHAVAADGTVLWSGALTPGQSLRAGNVHTPPGAAFGTAYFGAADGKLYAVAIEGHLDSAAPWPKAHHDARNTSNAAGPLP
jgi:outer membrane protein assembly factor BamB